MNYIIIVIYNKNCEESISLQCIKKYNIPDNFQIIIFDNSTSDLQNKQFCEENGFIYYGFNENRGLSKAYNYVISKIPHNNDSYLFIFDDDTFITQEYFNEANELIQLKEFDIILPIVKAGNLIISPCNTKYRSGARSVKSIADIDMKKITAINSGMIVKLSVYDSISYNEDLFLDCVDHDFMYSVRAKNYRIKIMNSVIFQNYSRKEKGSLEGAITRFNIYKKDFKVYAQKTANPFFYVLSMLKLAVENSVKYKNPVFVKMLITGKF